jgi:predicted phage gp36 major capsid-like protein
MARRSLKPQLNQIRAWVHQGRTDAWIAHQLEISATELREFRKQYDLSADDENAGSSEIDLRDEIEAEIEAAAAEQEDVDVEDEDGDEGSGEDSERDSAGEGRPKRRRRRGRRGGRGRRKELEATFDHGETDGYGLWLDASVKENPVYTEHWAGKREVTVRIDADQIVIRRAGSPEPESDDSGSDSDDE